MLALLDGDIFAYEFGSVTDSSTGDLLPWPLVASRVDSRIYAILEAVGASERRIYLTSPDRSNFRYRVATICPYKGNRPDDKPPYWEKIREWLVKYREAELIYGMEADDKCSIEQMKGLYEGRKTIICSRDKDLRMVPGEQYSWPAGAQKEQRFSQTELEGLKVFYKQLLTGDSVDNILGLYGVGRKSTLCASVDKCLSELDMYRIVRGAYYSRFGAYWRQFLVENAQLLWMVRDEYEQPELEIVRRLDGLEQEYQNEVETGRVDGLVALEE